MGVFHQRDGGHRVLEERGLHDTRCRRNHVNDGYFFEDAMIEFHASAENG